MITQTTRPLGILGLEPGAELTPESPGVALHPSTLGFPVISEKVTGGWAEDVSRGDPALESACIAAARRLVERGAVAISSECGFFIRHQAAVAKSVNVPVVLSSLLLLPTLLRQLPPPAKVAVLTFDSTRCTEDLLGIDDPAEQSRIVIGGIEGSKYWHDEQKRPPPACDVGTLEKDVTACVARVRAAHPDIAMILFECTGFPRVAPAIRRSTKLPVYDITTLARMTYASLV
ncbi:hypothetical protein [Mesorhizobium sp.]|uniref:hypothetical protein n=1 Tax=Mesorhizobium sp. TaxID=1871066 RepID=UPI0025EDE3A1|nr:hypothetical protein [Mesorhizobium sp.]